MAKKPLSDKDKEERKLARELGFHRGERGQRELNNFRARVTKLDHEDPRFIRPEEYNDLYALMVARNADKRHKTPIQAFIQKKQALVDNEDNRNHISAKAFQDRYREAILALLQGDASEYRKRSLRKALRDINQRIAAGDDAPLPAHIAESDKRTAMMMARFEAEKIKAPFMEQYEKHRRAAIAKEEKARENKYRGERTGHRVTKGHAYHTTKKKKRPPKRYGKGKK